MIQSRDDLISQAKQIENEEDRIKFVLDYLLDTVEYDYAFLFMAYAQGSIRAFETGYSMGTNKLPRDGQEPFALKTRVALGESELLDRIYSLRDKNEGNYEAFREDLRELVTEELTSHLGNEALVEDNTKRVVDMIEAELDKPLVFEEGNYAGYPFARDISTVFAQYYPREKEILAPEFENGIITKGVCQDYAKFLVPLFQEIGTDAHYIEGTSELGHAWVVAMVNGRPKSIDLTRAVFIKDGFKGIPKDQRIEDWLYSDLGDTFEMQPTRSISMIDGITLPEKIDRDNYDESAFISLLKARSDNTYQILVDDAVAKGEITPADLTSTDRMLAPEKEEGVRDNE